MESKTKIMVFRMRELIYTGILLALGIVLILLLVIMFRPEKSPVSQSPSTEPAENPSESSSRYVPGVYTTSIQLNNNTVDVEVTVDADRINSIRFVNLSETTAAMYPLMEAALEELAEQICTTQTTEGITYAKESQYTSQILLGAIEQALENARSQSKSP